MSLTLPDPKDERRKTKGERRFLVRLSFLLVRPSERRRRQRTDPTFQIPLYRLGPHPAHLVAEVHAALSVGRGTIQCPVSSGTSALRRSREQSSVVRGFPDD